MQIAVLCFAWMIASASGSSAATYTFSAVGYCSGTNSLSSCSPNLPIFGSFETDDVGNLLYVGAVDVWIDGAYGSYSALPPSAAAYYTDGVARYSVQLSYFGIYREISYITDPGFESWFRSTGQVLVYRDGVQVVPIPAALPLLAAALGGLGFIAWRRSRQYGS
jgi:hypothetical protein